MNLKVLFVVALALAGCQPHPQRAYVNVEVPTESRSRTLPDGTTVTRYGPKPKCVEPEREAPIATRTEQLQGTYDSVLDAFVLTGEPELYDPTGISFQPHVTITEDSASTAIAGDIIVCGSEDDW